ncbi:MAG: response regulator [Bdellovibrionales bacterium]|nr:response regulator [Bdellovibrionales bacterium]
MLKEKIILLVEDNQQDEILTIRALQKNNILNKVDVVRDGQEALDYIFRQGKYTHLENEPLPQFVLLDLKLPKLDGIEVLRAVRSNPKTKRLPVVILTTSSEDKDVCAGYDLGANSYVLKPVDFDKFMVAVNNLGMYWLVLNQGPEKESL